MIISIATTKKIKDHTNFFIFFFVINPFSKIRLTIYPRTIYTAKNTAVMIRFCSNDTGMPKI